LVVQNIAVLPDLYKQALLPFQPGFD
jgi:hypothetical protein